VFVASALEDYGANIDNFRMFEQLHDQDCSDFFEPCYFIQQIFSWEGNKEVYSKKLYNTLQQSG
jgi:hypothetical protein